MHDQTEKECPSNKNRDSKNPMANIACNCYQIKENRLTELANPMTQKEKCCERCIRKWDNDINSCRLFDTCPCHTPPVVNEKKESNSNHKICNETNPSCTNPYKCEHVCDCEKEIIAICTNCGAKFTEWLSDSKECPECEDILTFRDLLPSTPVNEDWEIEWEKLIYEKTISADIIKSFVHSQKELSRQAEHDRWVKALEGMKREPNHCQVKSDPSGEIISYNYVNQSQNKGYNQALEDLKERMK